MNNKGRRFLMTIPERKFYEKLQNNLDSNYVIFPQICIRSLMATDYDIDNRYKWCIVDYLICEKKYYEPLLVIELDDLTHMLEDRKLRDVEVDKILSDIDLPVLHLNSTGDLSRFDSFLNESVKNIITSYSKKIKREKIKRNIEKAIYKTLTFIGYMFEYKAFRLIFVMFIIWIISKII